MQPEARKYCLLVADDDHDTAETFATLVRMDGHAAHIAFDGESALQVAAEHRIDVAVLDIEMPKLNGYEVARRLRAGANGRDLILLAVTGWTSESVKSAARGAGFDAFLMKPLEFTQFEELLKNLPTAQVSSSDT